MADSQTFRHAIKKGILVLGDKETKFLCEQFENLMPIIEHIRVVVAGSMRVSSISFYPHQIAAVCYLLGARKGVTTGDISMVYLNGLSPFVLKTSGKTSGKTYGEHELKTFSLAPNPSQLSDLLPTLPKYIRVEEDPIVCGKKRKVSETDEYSEKDDNKRIKYECTAKRNASVICFEPGAGKTFSVCLYLAAISLKPSLLNLTIFKIRDMFDDRYSPCQEKYLFMTPNFKTPVKKSSLFFSTTRYVQFVPVHLIIVPAQVLGHWENSFAFFEKIFDTHVFDDIKKFQNYIERFFSDPQKTRDIVASRKFPAVIISINMVYLSYFRNVFTQNVKVFSLIYDEFDCSKRNFFPPEFENLILLSGTGTNAIKNMMSSKNPTFGSIKYSILNSLTSYMMSIPENMSSLLYEVVLKPILTTDDNAMRDVYKNNPNFKCTEPEITVTEIFLQNNGTWPCAQHGEHKRTEDFSKDTLPKYLFLGNEPCELNKKCYNSFLKPVQDILASIVDDMQKRRLPDPNYTHKKFDYNTNKGSSREEKFIKVGIFYFSIKQHSSFLRHLKLPDFKIFFISSVTACFEAEMEKIGAYRGDCLVFLPFRTSVGANMSFLTNILHLDNDKYDNFERIYQLLNRVVRPDSFYPNGTKKWCNVSVNIVKIREPHISGNPFSFDKKDDLQLKVVDKKMPSNQKLLEATIHDENTKRIHDTCRKDKISNKEGATGKRKKFSI